MRYFLIGLPGSGKSYWGKKWAEKMKLMYFDLDEIIVQNEGESISDIFKTEGEEHFRNLETFYLNKLTDNYNALLISTGGGTACFNNNMEVLNQKGTSIFLDPPLEQIAKRIWNPHEKNKRPLFSQCSSDLEVLEQLKILYKERAEFYLKASIHLQEWDECSLNNL